jgi:hypothetical protein
MVRINHNLSRDSIRAFNCLFKRSIIARFKGFGQKLFHDWNVLVAKLPRLWRRTNLMRKWVLSNVGKLSFKSWEFYRLEAIMRQLRRLRSRILSQDLFKIFHCCNNFSSKILLEFLYIETLILTIQINCSQYSTFLPGIGQKSSGIGLTWVLEMTLSGMRILSLSTKQFGKSLFSNSEELHKSTYSVRTLGIMILTFLTWTQSKWRF